MAALQQHMPQQDVSEMEVSPLRTAADIAAWQRLDDVIMVTQTRFTTAVDALTLKGVASAGLQCSGQTCCTW